MPTPPLCVSRVPIFAGISPSEQVEVHALARPRRVARGEIVYLEGEPAASLIVVNTGRLRLTKANADGDEQLLRVLEPGDFIGVESFLTGSHPGHTATAMADAVLCEFRHADLAGLLGTYPEVGAAMLGSLAAQLSRTEQRLAAQTLEPVERRVVDYLLDQPTRPHDHGLLVELPLTKKDIASYLGTTPESLSRSLRALTDAGIIETAGVAGIVVRDSVALEELLSR
ncbi:Crp/Fnr family transcriptional regulator [Georgenia sunbinii]|uniref:Crp/Fnr family transcriptional regulator n=1 Tax=Georgenia sunbinii TaxID=3117728 RepID=UPI002F266C5C